MQILLQLFILGELQQVAAIDDLLFISVPEGSVEIFDNPSQPFLFIRVTGSQNSVCRCFVMEQHCFMIHHILFAAVENDSVFLHRGKIPLGERSLQKEDVTVDDPAVFGELNHFLFSCC